MAQAVKPRVKWRDQLSALNRWVAVTLGAYGLTAIATAALSVLLARMIGRVEAVTAATIASFAIFAFASMAAFHARSARRAWGWLILLAGLSGLILILFAE
jgi:positive regulator of sigma E activity